MNMSAPVMTLFRMPLFCSSRRQVQFLWFSGPVDGRLTVRKRSGPTLQSMEFDAAWVVFATRQRAAC